MKRINIEQSGGIGYTIQQRRLAIMPWNEDPKEKSPKDLNEEQKEDSFSFLQETIKPEPITGKQVRKQLLKLAVYGIVVGAFACLGFYALNPWVQNLFPGSPKTVTIPEDSEETHPEEDEAQEQDSQEKNLRAEDYEAMMQSVYQIAAEAAKSVVTVRGEQDAANLTKDVNDEDMGCTGLIAADNGQELLILSNNSVCGESTVWNVQFSDGSTCEASLKKQVPSGMYVTQIQANSPAMAAGIQSGDVIQSVDGEEIASMAQYEKVLQKCKAGDTIRIQGKRLGAGGYVEISFQLVLDSRE